MAFEWYNPSTGSPIVSLAKYGLTFSAGAIELLGEAEYIMLGFDAENRIVAVKPCSENEERKLEFAKRIRNGNVRINSKDFIRFIESKMPDDFRVNDTATKYVAKWNKEQQALCVYLDQPIEQSN